jgi:hypothetical protein
MVGIRRPTRYNVRVSGFVPYKQREGYVLNGVPGPHMRRLTRLAEKQDTSLTNVAGSILAAEYEVEFERSDRKKPAANPEATTLYLMLPMEVLELIRYEAAEENVTMRAVILNHLSDRLGLKAPEPTHVDPGKRPGRPKKEQ